ncbi:hypothetical protein RP20_CCG021222 [Aedes albopictus]|nr:hypothetical protein RP20_CCG021222 [Aedes albopictus]
MAQTDPGYLDIGELLLIMDPQSDWKGTTAIHHHPCAHHSTRYKVEKVKAAERHQFDKVE